MARRQSRSDFKRVLAELGKDATDAAKQVLEFVATETVADAKARCPVKTGKLRDSIKAKKMDGGLSYKISARAINDSDSENPVEYGQYVEFDPKIKQPFLYPALHAHRAMLKELLGNAVRTAVKRNAKS